jgi:hypothetical protein
MKRTLLILLVLLVILKQLSLSLPVEQALASVPLSPRPFWFERRSIADISHEDFSD